LCVDENEGTLHSVCFSLSDHYEVHSCIEPAKAVSIGQTLKPHIVLLNPIIKRGRVNITALMEGFSHLESRPCVIMLCELAPPWLVDYTRDLGAAAFISNPWNPRWLLTKVTQVFARWYQSSHQSPSFSTDVSLSPQSSSFSIFNLPLQGTSECMSALRRSIALVSASDKPVLIRGETGTGKDLVAHCIHQASNRRGGPFVVRNVGAIPDSLLCAELFGCEKGAFTDAPARKGFISEAEGGTLFLDEIGEASTLFQVTLLRVIDSGDYQVLGSNETKRSSFRLLCATNRPLEEMVNKGLFRQDLWHRLNVLNISIPPLRLHMEDIPELVTTWCRSEGVDASIFDNDSFEWLKSQPWDGNVRELFNVLSRAWVFSGASKGRLCSKDFELP